MVYEYKRQPFRTIYLFTVVPLTLFVRLPFWCIYYLPSFNRPRRSWTWWNCITVNFFRAFANMGEIASKAGPFLLPQPTHYAIPKNQKVKSVWVEPTPHLIFGDVKKYAEINNVKTIRIPGYWYDREGHSVPVNDRPHPREKVHYYLHGGGYFAYSAHPITVYASMIKRLGALHPRIERSFAIEYRLTTGPPDELSGQFPGALLDALAGYVYLVKAVGFKPEDIILSSDSSGANLALALTRYLVEAARLPEAQNVLPEPPAGLLLISPWSDIGTSHEKPGSSIYTHLESDFVGPMDSGLLYHVRQNFVANLGFPHTANTNRYISPGSLHPDMPEVSFKGFPRTFILWGEAGILVDQIKTLWRKMTDQLGESSVAYFSGKDAPHDFVVFEAWSDQTEKAYAAIGEWMVSL